MLPLEFSEYTSYLPDNQVGAVELRISDQRADARTGWVLAGFQEFPRDLADLFAESVAVLRGFALAVFGVPRNDVMPEVRKDCPQVAAIGIDPRGNGSA
jgi:hypothetical protein